MRSPPTNWLVADRGDDANGCEEVCGVSVVSRGDAPEVLGSQEMAKAYSQDLRDRVIDAVKRGEMGRRAAGRRYEISESVAIKWLERVDGMARESLLDMAAIAPPS